MKQYIIQEDRKAVAIYDEITVRRAIFPLWLFSNPRKDINNKSYFCFLGCNFPDGIQNIDEDEWQAAYKYMNTTFLDDMRKVSAKEKKIGWGEGNTPTEAYRAAGRSAGLFKVT